MPKTRLKPFTVTNNRLSVYDEYIADFLKKLRKYKRLTPNEEEELIIKSKQGDPKSLELLVQSHMGFVLTVAKKYQNKGLELCDLIQEGCLGLLYAIEKFDPTRGCKFITYSIYWIRQYIIKALQYDSRTIRLPLNQLSNWIKIKKEEERFQQRNNREPSVLELEDLTNIDHNNINPILASSVKAVSYDKILSDEDGFTILDVTPDFSTPDTDSELIRNDLHDKIYRIINNLPKRERIVICRYFGLGVIPKPCAEIGKDLSLSSERVRQILKHTLKKIRRRYANDLKDFL